ncbi:MAG TPA: ABC transporter substrate-binding protein [Chloroflexota bacterium]|jgi:NitT/TauT family transport system substrate-binding protein
MRLLALALCLWPILACQPAAAPSAPAGGVAASAPAVPTTAPSGPLPTVAAAAAQPSATPAPAALRFGLNTTTAEVTPAWIAKDTGIFTKYALDVELATLSADLIVPALISGELAASHLGSTPLVNSVVGGSDLVYISSYGNYLRFWLYARPDVAELQDLRGKQVAITSRGGIIKTATELTLERAGMDPEADVTLIATGNLTNSVTSLVQGAVAAAMLGPPATFRAEDEGMRLLLNTADYKLPMMMSGVATTHKWVAANESVARRLIQALAEGVAFAHREKDRTKEIIAQHIQADDPALLERTYNALLPGWETDQHALPDAVRYDVEAAAKENPAARTLRPEQLVDNHLVDELDRAGFFRQVFQ